jgi:hypothetical protein
MPTAEGRGVRRRTGKIEKSQIAREVLAYLAEHPKAQDTLEGIIEWWLLEREIKRQTTLVKEALGDLVATGLLIECRSTGDAHVRYQVNRDRLREIPQLIEK